MESEFQWKTYGNYRLVLWIWMMGEITVVFSPIVISHDGFYLQGSIYILSAIFIGIPLVYSEICISQYTNCNAVSMWNFFPIMRCVGYGTILLIVYKTFYLFILSSLYMNYAFHAALDPPPWFSCDDFKDMQCMVKRINTSVFQYCIETQILFDDDCGMKTASYCFFEREIGRRITMNKNCTFHWKFFMISCSIGCVIFCMFLKKEKLIHIAFKILVTYVSFVVFTLFCVALSAGGAWYASKLHFDWYDYDWKPSIFTLTRGVLSLGTGSGMIAFLSRHIPFRSPATMTSIAVPLFAILYCIIFSLVIYSGIKSMSYYHGEEENVLEQDDNSLFSVFASVAEIMGYYDGRSIWSFLWFSTIFLCLFFNLSILIHYLHELLITNSITLGRYKNFCCAGVILILCLVSCPLFCSDLIVALTDATEIIQLVNTFLFSISLYWIYGYNNHNVDIIFMIGVKAGYFWKIAWSTNPISLLILTYIRSSRLKVYEFDNSYIIESLGIPCNVFLFYVLVSIYAFTCLVGIVYEIISFHLRYSIRNIIYPMKKWGPVDKILFRSRKMFVPEIMTREFLYRQVRIHGYLKENVSEDVKVSYNRSKSFAEEKIEWSALTSN